MPRGALYPKASRGGAFEKMIFMALKNKQKWKNLTLKNTSTVDCANIRKK